MNTLGNESLSRILRDRSYLANIVRSKSSLRIFFKKYTNIQTAKLIDFTFHYQNENKDFVNPDNKM